MDTQLKGYITEVRITRFPDDRSVSVHFKLVDKCEHAVIKGLKCYMVPEHKVADEIEKLNLSKEYILDGCICSTEEGVTDFQVHRLYEVPKYIWG